MSTAKTNIGNTQGRYKRALQVTTSLAALILSASVSTAFAQEQNIDVDAGSAADALAKFGQQADVSVVYSYSSLQDFKTNAVQGQ